MCGSIASRTPSGMALVPALSRSCAVALSSTPARMNQKLTRVMVASLWLSYYYVTRAARRDFHRQVELAAQALEVAHGKNGVGLALALPGARKTGVIGDEGARLPGDRLLELILVADHGDGPAQRPRDGVIVGLDGEDRGIARRRLRQRSDQRRRAVGRRERRVSGGADHQRAQHARRQGSHGTPGAAARGQYRCAAGSGKPDQRRGDEPRNKPSAKAAQALHFPRGEPPRRAAKQHRTHRGKQRLCDQEPIVGPAREKAAGKDGECRNQRQDVRRQLRAGGGKETE